VPGELTKLVRKRVEEICAGFTPQVEALGFERTRKMFWVRLHEQTADVLHIHRGGISYGAPLNASVGFRLHLAIRVLNASFPAIALNGPTTDGAPREGRYHLRFNAESLHSFDRCVHDLARYVREIGEPWFSRFRDPLVLLQDGASPLQDDDKAGLRAALEGRDVAENLATSKKELGLKQ
jgi:hypothetical protein